jgi:hypothetical protein
VALAVVAAAGAGAGAAVVEPVVAVEPAPQVEQVRRVLRAQVRLAGVQVAVVVAVGVAGVGVVAIHPKVSRPPRASTPIR